jgi:tetratricopeptide (TPR) repeat protein
MIRELAPNANEDAVIDDLNHAIAITPRADNLYFARGHAYAGKKDYAHAVADYNKAISLSTDPAIYRSERADANLKWGKVDEAFAEMAELIRLNGDGLNAAVMLPNLLDQRGRMYEAAGQRDKAIADYRRILTLGPKFNEVGMAAQFDDAAAEAHRNLKRLGAK